jgi:hypothetical protein
MTGHPADMTTIRVQPSYPEARRPLAPSAGAGKVAAQIARERALGAAGKRSVGWRRSGAVAS